MPFKNKCTEEDPIRIEHYLGWCIDVQRYASDDEEWFYWGATRSTRIRTHGVKGRRPKDTERGALQAAKIAVKEAQSCLRKTFRDQYGRRK